MFFKLSKNIEPWQESAQMASNIVSEEHGEVKHELFIKEFLPKALKAYNQKASILNLPKIDQKWIFIIRFREEDPRL